MGDGLRAKDYKALADFRYELRRFLRFSEVAAVEAGLTATQHQALLAICAARSGGMLISELAERLLLRPHSVTGLVDRLVKSGLVVREQDQADRRQVPVVLTVEARKSLASLAATHRDELRRLQPLLTGLISNL